MTIKHALPGFQPSLFMLRPERRARRAPPRPPTRRVRHAPAVAALPAPSLSVWAGEVLLLVGPEPAQLLVTACALWAVGGGRVRVAYVRAATPAGADAIVARASPSVAVVAAACVPAAVGATAAIEALRRAVARAVPCRCVRLPAASNSPCLVPLPGPH